MKFKKKNFGGDCPKFTMPPVMVGGGFTLIAEQAGKSPKAGLSLQEHWLWWMRASERLRLLLQVV